MTPMSVAPPRPDPRLTALLDAQPAAAALLEALEAQGYAAHLVGGTVRDALLGRPVKDLDIATAARPTRVRKIATRAGWHSVATGIDHGTVTVLVDDTPIEVTTWRHDISTDGRNATIGYSDNVHDDAIRRDFTLNALYADRQGRILDPTGQGLADLAAGRLRFVGDPAARIFEDGLRILRLYRFLSTLDLPAGPSQDRHAAAAGRARLERVSPERFGKELLGLLAGPGAAEALAAMVADGVWQDILPEAPLTPNTARALMARARTIETVFEMPADPIARLACLLDTDTATSPAPATRLRLSKASRKRLALLATHADGLDAPAGLGYRLGSQDARAALMRRWARADTAPDRKAGGRIDHGAAQVFPVTAHDLMPAFTGPALGAEIERLRALWIAHDFSLPSDSLQA